MNAVCSEELARKSSGNILIIDRVRHQMLLHRSKRFSIIPIFLLFCIAVGHAGADVKSKITDATRGFKDISLTSRVEKAEVKELDKIGSDFSKGYAFKTTTVRFKSPDKMRIDGKLGLVSMSVVINGDDKVTRVPLLRIAKKDNVAKEVPKRQSDLDIGIISGSFWDNYEVKGAVEESGDDGPVYKITYVSNSKKKDESVIWVDAKTLKLLKHERYRNGKMKARFIYLDHSYVQGIVWVPTRIQVYNQEGKLAGVTVNENIRVNTGIPDAVFKL